MTPEEYDEGTKLLGRIDDLTESLNRVNAKGIKIISESEDVSVFIDMVALKTQVADAIYIELEATKTLFDNL